jgi:hypothetical protein
MARPALDEQLDRITANYLKPFFELLRAIANGMLLQQNLLIISKGFQDAAVRMHTPTRRIEGTSGVLRETLAELNATLANKTRMTSLTFIILQLVRNEATSASEAQMIDAALRSVDALRRAQLQGAHAAIDVGYAEVSAVVQGPDRTASETYPIAVAGERVTPSDALDTTARTLDWNMTEMVSEIAAGTVAERTTELMTQAPPYAGATLKTTCIRGLSWASGESVRRAKPAQFATLDGVPLLWSPDANDTWAWRLLPPYLYAELIAVPVHSSTYFTREGQGYLQMFGCTFAVAALRDEKLWAIGPPGDSLPPMPLVQFDLPNAIVNATTTANAWAFAVPREDDEALSASLLDGFAASLLPSEDGFVRWQNKKFICYNERLRAVAPVTIQGEERIRTLAVAVPAPLGAPDRQGILHASDGRRLIEGQYGYYPLLEGSDRRGPHDSIYRISSHGLASMAEVSFNAATRHWYVVATEHADLWFSTVSDATDDNLDVYRRLGLDLVFRLQAAQQALTSASFLEQRSDLRLALRSTFNGLIERVLRFNKSPAMQFGSAQARLSAIWSSLTSLVPTVAQWQRLSLVQQQSFLAENIALFFDLASDFPLNGVVHQVQMTALGMDALQDLQRDHVILQVNWRFGSAGDEEAIAWDGLLYMDSPDLLPVFLQMMGDGDDAMFAESNAFSSFDTSVELPEHLPVHLPVHLSANGMSDSVSASGTDASLTEAFPVQALLEPTQVPPGIRTSFAAWLFAHRENVALIHFSTWDGLCSFQNASSEAEVSDMIDLFFLDTPAPKNVPYTVQPRQPMRTGYV